MLFFLLNSETVLSSLNQTALKSLTLKVSNIQASKCCLYSKTILSYLAKVAIEDLVTFLIIILFKD